MFCHRCHPTRWEFGDPKDPTEHMETPRTSRGTWRFLHGPPKTHGDPTSSTKGTWGSLRGSHMAQGDPQDTWAPPKTLPRVNGDPTSHMGTLPRPHRAMRIPSKSSHGTQAPPKTLGILPKRPTKRTGIPPRLRCTPGLSPMGPPLTVGGVAVGGPSQSPPQCPVHKQGGLPVPPSPRCPVPGDVTSAAPLHHPRGRGLLPGAKAGGRACPDPGDFGMDAKSAGWGGDTGMGGGGTHDTGMGVPVPSWGRGGEAGWS